MRCRGRILCAVTAAIAAILFVPSVTSTDGGTDNTLTPGAKGSSVVETVIARIEASCIFPDDKLFVRRLSYVESYDGTDPKTFRDGYYGGIWQVDQSMFDVTQSSAANSALLTYKNAIKSAFGITWASVTWQDLTKPLHSALAARLYIEYRRGSVQIPRAIADQANFWKSYYRPAGLVSDFIDKSNKLENGCKNVSVGADIVFVLDGSGSITSTNFLKIKEFVKSVVSAFGVGTDSSSTRFGVIQFSSTVRHEFYLKTYTTAAAINSAVDRIVYLNSGTNTYLALDELRLNGFSTANGARTGHPKVGIVLTDGLSGNKQLTLTAAQKCHDALFTMFAVGVGSSLDDAELQAIASDPNCLHLTYLSFADLDSLKYAIQKRACDAPVNIVPGQNSTLGGQFPPGGNQNCRIKIPTAGATVTLDSVGGSGAFFASKTSYPTSDFYDQKTVSGPDRLGVLYVPYDASVADSNWFCNIQGDDKTQSNITVGCEEGNKDKCKGNDCQNGATCINTRTGYRCECPDGFIGDKCEKPVESTPNPTTTTVITTDTTTSPSCHQWQSYSHTQGVGATQVLQCTTLDACLDACKNNPDCSGVDYDVFEFPCWLHLQPFTPTPTAAVVTQYVLNRNCLNDPPESCYQWTRFDLQQSSKGVQQPNGYSVKNCKQTCEWNPLCVGIDVNFENFPGSPCWLIESQEGLAPENTFPWNEVNQYRLQRLC